MDEIFEELEYNEKEGLLTKKVYIDIWGVSDYEMELMVQCGKNQEITEAQREAYKDYLSKVDTIASEIPLLMLAYYKEHYEDIERRWQLDDDLKIDVVDKNVLLNGFDLKKIFIDRNGNYGWLVEFIWDDYPITLVLSDDKIEIYEGWNVLKENYAKVNDSVFGELEYDKNGFLKTKIFLGIWGGDDEELDLIIKCQENEEILDIQRKAYKTYLADLQRISKEIPPLLLDYYKDHYEDIERRWPLDDELRIDVVEKITLINLFDIKSLFIDRNGNYGWLVEFIWDEFPISVILSDDKIEIYEGWNVLKENYAKVNDEAFGEMFYDSSWQKSVKKDLYGVTGRWIHVVADADQGKEINESQRKAYLEYLEKEEDFLDDIPDAVITYYLQNYEDIEEWNNIPQKYNKQNITMYSVMELITFKDLYFDTDGRYGWLCDCPWDSSGLAIVLSGEEIEVTVQDELI